MANEHCTNRREPHDFRVNEVSIRLDIVGACRKPLLRLYEKTQAWPELTGLRVPDAHNAEARVFLKPLLTCRCEPFLNPRRKQTRHYGQQHGQND